MGSALVNTTFFFFFLFKGGPIATFQTRLYGKSIAAFINVAIGLAIYIYIFKGGPIATFKTRL